MEPTLTHPSARLIIGDVIDSLCTLAPSSVHTVITSPPYFGLRDYGIPGRIWDAVEGCQHVWGQPLPAHHPGQVEQTKYKSAVAAGAGQTLASGQYCQKCPAWLGVLGQEPTVDMYVSHLVEVFAAVRRVLRDDGTLWLNLGDAYASGGRHDEPRKYPGAAKPIRPRQRRLTSKDLLMVPARVALALQADGWVLRQDIIWGKGVSFCPSYSGSVMPESTRDRPTWAHEHVFLLTKGVRYYYDIDGAREPYATVRGERPYRGQGVKPYADAGVQNPSDTKRRVQLAMAAGVGRNLRNVWVIGKGAGTRAAHFATFPHALVKPMVQLGTSDMGACPDCGAQMVRQVEREAVPAAIQQQFEQARTATAASTGRTDGHTGSKPNHVRKVTGVSWHQGCACEYVDPVPATVLDPFSGSATTGVVANRMGRSYIGIDVSEAYTRDIAAVALPHARIDQVTGTTAVDSSGSVASAMEPLLPFEVADGL